MGEMDRRTDQNQPAGNLTGSRFNLQSVRGEAIQVFDTRVGVKYKAGNLGLQLGYEFQKWAELHDRTVTGGGGGSSATFEDVGKVDVNLEGPFFKAIWGF